VTGAKRYKLTEIREMGPDVKAFRFEPVEGEVPAYMPGHFTVLHLLDEKGETVVKRPYSVASAPHMPCIELCIKLVKGELTGRLEGIEIGTVVGIEDPVGHMPYRDEPKAAFIAGGTGITPFMSMLRHIAEKNIQGEFVLFYSARKKEHILYREELEELQERNPGIKVVVTLTREEGEWEGEKGRLCHEIVGKYVASPKEFRWWICGPMGLTKAMKECLLSAGVDPKGIKMEGWG
jgi:ferredoxin-NADP reductase